MTLKEKNNKYIIFLSKEEIKNISPNDINKMKEYFIKLFTKIKNKYLSFKYGFYKLNIYLDKYYGGVIEIKNINSNYLLSDEVEMTINIIDDNFLYLIDEYKLDKKYFDYYSYNNKLYAKIKCELSCDKMYNLLENSEIIFNTQNLIASSKKI